MAVESAMATAAEQLELVDIRFEKATMACGAYVEGVDLSQEQTDAAIGTIAQGLHEHGVIVFRDQHALTPESQKAFAARFGELHVHPFVPSLPGHPEIMLLRNEGARNKSFKGIRWHADSTWEAKPPRASLLRAVHLPSVGGDTTWASMYAAYDALSEPMKRFLDPLRAVHDAAVQGRLTHFTTDNAQKELKAASHPVVITDPIRGGKALFVNPGYTTYIEGVTREESDMLLAYLYAHQTKPEFCFRLHWEPGMVAFWCNTVTQHMPIRDYDELREMHRLAILSDTAPV
jgi:taurine dioxygenase